MCGAAAGPVVQKSVRIDAHCFVAGPSKRTSDLPLASFVVTMRRNVCVMRLPPELAAMILSSDGDSSSRGPAPAPRPRLPRRNRVATLKAFPP